MNEIFEQIDKIPEQKIPQVKTLTVGVRQDQLVHPTRRDRTDIADPAFMSMRDDEHIRALQINQFHYEYFFSAVASASHTNRKMRNPDYPSEMTPAHLVSWMPVENAELKLYDIHPANIRNLALSITKNALYINNDTGEKPYIYQLYGYTSPKSTEKHGLTGGGASNKYVHFHQTLPPEVDLKETSEANSRDKYKYYAPLGGLFTDVWPEVVQSLLKKSQLFAVDISDDVVEGNAQPFPPHYEELIYDGNAEVGEYKDPNNELAVGSTIKIESTHLKDYLETVFTLEGRLNQIYQSVKESAGSQYYAGDVDAGRTKQKSIRKLASLGINQELAEKIYEKAELFKPTLRQVETWLKKKNLPNDKRLKLEKMRDTYLINKKRIANAIADPENPLRTRLIKRYGEEKSEIILNIFKNQYLGPQEGKPEFTLNENISLKFVIKDTDYDIDNGEYTKEENRMVVHSADVVLLFGSIGGNTIENAAGVVTTR